MWRPGKLQHQDWPNLHTKMYSSVKKQVTVSIFYIMKSLCTRSQCVMTGTRTVMLFLWVLFSVKGRKFCQSTSIISGSSAKGENMTLYYSQKTAAEREEKFYEFWCQMFSKVPVHVCVCNVCVYVGKCEHLWLVACVVMTFSLLAVLK